MTMGTRREQLKAVADMWLSEEENSRYRYDVETCSNGKKIYLTRPAGLNNGFDFQVELEGFHRASKRPSHADIVEDLKLKKAQSLSEYVRFRGVIDSVYECDEPDTLLAAQPNFAFGVGLPEDCLLKILKWLFIEQDLTYWNGQGRRMFMDGIRKLD